MTQAVTGSAAIPTARPMEYLSVYDIVWINSTITGETPPFNYVTLEEAMAAQYSYGKSTDVERQAANLLATLVRKRPFQFGNLRTAYIATSAFLTANGYALRASDPDAARIVREVADGSLSASDATSSLAGQAEPPAATGLTLRALVAHLLNARSEAVRLLADGDR